MQRPFVYLFILVIANSTISGRVYGFVTFDFSNLIAEIKHMEKTYGGYKRQGLLAYATWNRLKMAQKNIQTLKKFWRIPICR